MIVLCIYAKIQVTLLIIINWKKLQDIKLFSPIHKVNSLRD